MDIPGVPWPDPEFDPSRAAFDHARAIEIPSPRRTACDPVRFGEEVSDEAPMATQERADTSTICYTPQDSVETGESDVTAAATEEPDMQADLGVWPMRLRLAF